MIDGVESITEVGTDEGGDHTDTAVHLVPGFPEGANLGGKNRRDESLPSLITRVVDDVENIVDGVGLTDTVDELGLGFKEKRQGDILTEVENLLAERENELTGTVDSALGLDGLFPVSSKRSDSIAELVDALESTPDSATSELGLGSLGLKEKRRDVFDFTDTVVVDAVGQIDKTIGAAPLLEGSLP